MAKSAVQSAKPLRERATKRSITVRPEVDRAVALIVGDGDYSSFVNDALVLALQARGIDAAVESFVCEHGPIDNVARETIRARRLQASAIASRTR
jgi:hypothetical protein